MERRRDTGTVQGPDGVWIKQRRYIMMFLDEWRLCDDFDEFP